MDQRDDQLSFKPTLLMLSIPPATTTVDSPVWMDWAPRQIDFRPEPHTIWQLQAETGYGIPAATLAWRAGFCPLPKSR